MEKLWRHKDEPEKSIRIRRCSWWVCALSCVRLYGPEAWRKVSSQAFGKREAFFPSLGVIKVQRIIADVVILGWECRVQNIQRPTASNWGHHLQSSSYWQSRHCNKKVPGFVLPLPPCSQQNASPQQHHLVGKVMKKAEPSAIQCREAI